MNPIPKVVQAPGEERLARYLFIDPGETYGWASFNAHGELVGLGQFRFEGDVKVIDNLITEHIVWVGIEDYRNFGFAQQKRWSRNQTSKNIGKIETICQLKSVPYSLLQSGNKTTGYMMLGIEPPKNHSISHQYDAAAHGVQKLTSEGIRNAILNIPEDER